MTDRALVFDMDGVLIDSEPLWRRAEVACFGEVGLALEERDCRETMGLRIDEACAYWFERAPWTGPSVHDVALRIVDRMATLVAAEGEPMPGARRAIEAAQDEGFRLALASSSPMRLIEAVLDRFGWRDAFEVLRSAEDEARGKPAPDVYVATIRALELAPERAIAIEDSANGVRSARAAGLRCIAVPEAAARHDPVFTNLATWRFDSLDEVARALADLRTEHADDGDEGVRAAETTP